MSNNLMVPITDEQAKVLQEAAKFGTRALDTTEKIGAYAAQVVGNLPQNFVGVVIGDYLAQVRIRNWARMWEKTEKVLQARGLKPPYEDLSPAVAIPLLQAAVDETRDELQELWVRLIASAMDPSRRAFARMSFMDIIKRLEPIDAALLRSLRAERGELMPHVVGFLANEHKISQDEAEVSLQNLINLGLLQDLRSNIQRPVLTTTGKVFLRAVGE